MSNINKKTSPLISIEEIAKNTVSGLPSELNPNAPKVTLHLLSDENEYACITLEKKTTDQEVVDAYSKFFPKEAKKFRDYIEIENANLHRSNGMSVGGRMMRIGSVPEFIRIAMQYIHGQDYWERPHQFNKFVRKFKGFAIGDHSKKETKGIIIK